MITCNELQTNMYTLKGNLKGVKLFSKYAHSDNLERMIERDITSNFNQINKLNIDVQIEDYEDATEIKQCSLFNFEILIQFKNKNKNDMEVLEFLGKYLSETFVK